MNSVRSARAWAAGLAALVGTAIAGQAQAATATGSFTVSLVVQAECNVASASNLDFGTAGVLTSAVDATSTLGVQCTDGTPYTISLDAGAGAGASVSTRKLTSGGATVDYTLYSEPTRSNVWGNTAGSMVSDTGNGSSQTHTVYGRIAAQATPAAGTYTDTIQVTVTY